MTGGTAARTRSPTTKSGLDARPALDNVAAVIVTHHPDVGLVERVRPLIGQVSAIVIVDNASSEAEFAPVDALERGGVAVSIRNDTNLGIATALNRGLSWAESNGYAWALTLDQDTAPGPDVVSEAARVFDAYPTPPPAAIGAGRSREKSEGAVGHVTDAIVTAGALHSIRLWASLGRFREDFFIDYVDVEFCLRARARGYAVLVGCRPTIQHEIGAPMRHETPFRSFTPSNHNRIRRYYITRNRILVWRGYWRREPRYVSADIQAAVKEMIKLVLFEQDRPAKVRAVLRGHYDGLRGATTQRW